MIPLPRLYQRVAKFASLTCADAHSYKSRPQLSPAEQRANAPCCAQLQVCIDCGHYLVDYLKEGLSDILILMNRLTVSIYGINLDLDNLQSTPCH